MAVPVAPVFVFDNLFISLCTAGLVKVTQAVLLLDTSVSPLDGFVFCSTLLVYNLHGSVSQLPQQTPRAIVRELFAARSQVPGRGLILAGLAGTAVAFFFLHPHQQIAACAMAAVTLAYTFPLIRIRQKRKRFREIFLLKVCLIGAVWSFATVLLPVLPLPVPFLSTALLFFERFLLIIAITIPFEIRDMEQEKRWGNLTLPVALGVRVSKRLAVGLLVLYEVLILAHAAFTIAPPLILAALALSALPAAVVVLLTREGRSNFFYKFYVDGTMLLQFLFVTLVS